MSADSGVSSLWRQQNLVGRDVDLRQGLGVLFKVQPSTSAATTSAEGQGDGEENLWDILDNKISETQSSTMSLQMQQLNTTFYVLSICICLTVLIAAPGLLVSGENVITCDGDIHRLTCDRGVIWVENSLYGRTDSSICSTAHPPLQVTDTSCSMSISTIAERCNGLSACEVNTAALQTSDPCKGTYKYYDTSYSCYDAETTVICEHSYSTLECAEGEYLQIIIANFGRSDSTTCSSGLHSGLTKKTNCYASNTLSTLATLCNNQQSCTVEASSTIFTDPCPNTAKYLSVSYICYGEQSVLDYTLDYAFLFSRQMTSENFKPSLGSHKVLILMKLYVYYGELDSAHPDVRFGFSLRNAIFCIVTAVPYSAVPARALWWRSRAQSLWDRDVSGPEGGSPGINNPYVSEDFCFLGDSRERS
ncbi:rhamnose-binding lectin-like [Ictalurus furcatus]|uniref:rhamnose-binding lectin-like n=1 Tax=Ictalurus furcatus TaxID=66913 RepID=UPI0023500542|nr:rhamnose-binding lectin-like [Ictalurus furcatus]